MSLQNTTSSLSIYYVLKKTSLPQHSVHPLVAKLLQLNNIVLRDSRPVRDRLRLPQRDGMRGECMKF